MEPPTKTTIDTWISSFLLNSSPSLPQIGVLAVEASRVAVTTQVYWLCEPRSSVMIVGRALDTTVEDRNATNIASNIPDRADRICWWVMPPCCSTGARAAGAAGPAAAGRWCVGLMKRSPGVPAVVASGIPVSAISLQQATDARCDGPHNATGAHRTVRSGGRPSYASAVRQSSASASSTSSTGCQAFRSVPWKICCRQETPVAAMTVSWAAARTAGKSRSSPTCSEMS